ncbi:BTB/POZ domain-containing protein [Aspergillus stella-maris]|uniref:BTB/POZ domain-containing protein n=1 Tax=Aspergillus stella-maris TaxID=1810926 RepID=UPI003CCCEA74
MDGHDSPELVPKGRSNGPPSSKPRDTVELQVGERCFTTTRETLISESTYFEALLSDRWDAARPDGSYFIDADPTLFEHILRYLRRPSAPPIFYDIVKGHDFPLYNALLEEAKYFGVDSLMEYLSNQQYIYRVKINLTIDHDYKPYTPLFGFSSTADPRSETHMTYHPLWEKTKVYMCPRGIDRHRGHPLECGRRCASARGSDGYQYEDEYRLKVVAFKTKVSINVP